MRNAKSLMLWLAMACVAAVATERAPVAPAQDEIMPVTIKLSDTGPEYPLVAKDGDKYFAVFVAKGGQPYFSNAEGRSVPVQGRDKSYALYYLSDKADQPVALPEPDPRSVTLLGGTERGSFRNLGELEASVPGTQLVHFWHGRRRHYYRAHWGYGGYGFRPYYRSYYSSYVYGWSYRSYYYSGWRATWHYGNPYCFG